MSLEDLRRLAEEEGAGEAPEAPAEGEGEQEPEAAKAETGDGSSEPETGAAEEAPSDDFELALDGEPEPGQQKPDPEEALIHKLTKQRKRAQKAETTAESEKARADKLEAEIEALKAQIAGKQPAPQAAPAPAPNKFPDLYDRGIDGDAAKHAQAVAKWHDDRAAQQAQQQQAEAMQRQREERLDNHRLDLAKRAAAFAKEHNISADRTADAIHRACDEVDASTGIDGSMIHLLSFVGDGGERAAYYLGTNETAMAAVKQALQEDPDGFKAMSLLTRYALKAKPKGRATTSNAPPPDEALRGDSSSASAHDLQEKYDKAANDGDVAKARAIKKEALAKGVVLK